MCIILERWTENINFIPSPDSRVFVIAINETLLTLIKILVQNMLAPWERTYDAVIEKSKVNRKCQLNIPSQTQLLGSVDKLLKPYLVAEVRIYKSLLCRIHNC